jgi:glycosyltransferase involved in cell wall biosynthesis
MVTIYSLAGLPDINYSLISAPDAAFMTSPAITVLMPVHNGGACLQLAVESILNQSFSDFELLIVDDGSTDSAIDQLYQSADTRLRIDRTVTRKGIVNALNHGLRSARGTMIVRMDADDISETNRLEDQFAFLSANPSIGVCGSDFTPIGDKSASSWINYSDPEDVSIALLFENPICHPTVMLRRELLSLEGYPSAYPHAEDYALWIRLSGQTQLANIASCLLSYRSHSGQVSREQNEVQCRSIHRLQHELLSSMGITASQHEMALHHALASGFYPLPRLNEALAGWIEKLMNANANVKRYPPSTFHHQLQSRRLNCLVRTETLLASMTLHQRVRWQARSWICSKR